MNQIGQRPSIIGAAGLVASEVWVLGTNWDPVANGHPSYLIFYLGLVGLGVWLLWRWRASRDKPARTGRSLLAMTGLLALTALSIWLSPLGADNRALDALVATEKVTVTESPTRITFEPNQTQPRLAVIFHPGAKVDARAYAHTLLPLAEAGHRIVIVKEPLGIAFLSGGFVASAIEDAPGIDHWAVGGHSLGGVAASSDAGAENISGLLLWASYPASDISDVGSLEVGSIYGTNDGLSEPQRVEASAEDLPPSATFTAIDGAVHSHFGDYGAQPGDGEPGIDRESAQEQIVKASLELLGTISSR